MLFRTNNILFRKLPLIGPPLSLPEYIAVYYMLYCTSYHIMLYHMVVIIIIIIVDIIVMNNDNVTITIMFTTLKYH